MIAEANDSQLYVGTTRNCIMHGNAADGFKPIVTGHSDELWGLAADSSSAKFVTAGQDKRLKIWDAEAKAMSLDKDLEVYIFNLTRKNSYIPVFRSKHRVWRVHQIIV